MTLVRMEGQRRRHEVGDLFVLQVERDKKFRFGRIVKMGETTREARFPGEMLVYVYDLADDNDKRLDRRYEPCDWFSLARMDITESEIDEALDKRSSA
jgi:hypothetical protein